jgi:malate synthase
MTATASSSPQVVGGNTTHGARVLTPDALAFLARLQRHFNPVRERLLEARRTRRREIERGAALDFLPSTASVRESAWRVASAPPDLEDRRVEITGPTDRKMMINALNSGARVFMADLEDACSPTWENVVEGQSNLMDAVRRTLRLSAGEKEYVLAENTATLVVRPRGWHLTERHVTVDGAPMSASLFDFGLYLFHNAHELLARGTGPYFYLPKMESHLEARLWNDVFVFAQETLNVPSGTIRATVLVETILAAFEMEEILYELRDHAAGLNAGRWDYLFSLIKTFRDRSDMVLPDRAQLTMAVPFMRSYAQLLVKTCHKRGAHAIGGMAAFIPNRRDPEVTQRALAKVREDKERESGDGFDGTWVAHPDLVPVATEVFDRVLGDRTRQKSGQCDDVLPSGPALVDVRIEGGRVTRQGVFTNVDVAIRYIEAWLRGQGAVAIHNLMEDAITAEISRSQLWQWLRHATPLADGGTMTAQEYAEAREQVLASLLESASGGSESRYDDAARLLDDLVRGDFQEFLTVPGYRMLDRG